MEPSRDGPFHRRGVVFDSETSLRLVHCPRRKSLRVRDDVVLQISQDKEVLKEAEKWAKETWDGRTNDDFFILSEVFFNAF